MTNFGPGSSRSLATASSAYVLKVVLARPVRFGQVQAFEEGRHGTRVKEPVLEVARARRRGHGVVDVGAAVDAGRIERAADVVVAVPEGLELARDRRILEPLVGGRDVLAAGTLGRRDRVEMLHLDRRRDREHGPDVVRVTVLEHREAMRLEPLRQVVVDAVLELQGALGAVAIEDEPVDVALRRSRRRPDGLDLGDRGAVHEGADLERDDQDERDDHEDAADPIERPVDRGDATLVEADGGDHGDDHEGRPAGLLDERRHVDAHEQMVGMPVHQQSDHQRGRDERTSPAIAEDEAQHDGHEGRAEHDGQEREQHLAGVRLAQVLRPQEQHRVGGEEQGMDGSKSIARAGAVDCGNAGQGDLRSERLFG